MRAPRTFTLLVELDPDAHARLADMTDAHGSTSRVLLRPVPRRLAATPELVAAMVTDLQRLVALGSPHLQVTADLARLDEGLFFIAEPRAALDLASAARITPLPWLPFVVHGLVASAARGLAAARSAEVVHGALSAEHIRVDGAGRVHVIGLAEVRPELATAHGTSDLARVRVDHLPPEQLVARRPVPTEAGDIYALGTLWLAWATGEAPGRARLRPDDHAAFIGKQLEGLSGRAGDARIDEIHRRMLSFDPNERPTALEVAERLGKPGPAFEAEMTRWVAGLPDFRAELSRDGILGHSLTERPVHASSDDTAPWPHARVPAPDPEATQEPLSEARAARWVRLQARSLDSLSDSVPASSAPPARAKAQLGTLVRARRRSEPPPRVFRRSEPKTAPLVVPERRTHPWVGLAIGLGLLVIATSGLGLASLGAWVMWSTAPATSATTFRSGWGDTERMLVQCGSEQAHGARSVTIHGAQDQPCIVRAVGRDRQQRSTVVPNAQPVTYLCFAIGNDECVEMQSRRR